MQQIPDVIRATYLTAAMFSTIGLIAVQARAETEAFDAGTWNGSAYFDDSTGAFGNCSAFSKYEGGYELWLGLNADFTLWVAVSSYAWNLPTDATFRISLRVDRRWSRTFTGRAIGPQDVLIEIGDDFDGYQALRRGAGLHVEAARDTFSFRLDGSSLALQRTAQCVLTRVAGNTTDPFTTSNDPFTTGAPAQDTANIAGTTDAGLDRKAMTGFLIAAGLGDAVFIEDAEALKTIGNPLHAWVFGDTFGAVYVFSGTGKSPDENAGSFVGGVGESCDGEFASGKKPVQSTRTYAIRRFFTLCRGSDGPIYIAGTLSQSGQDAVVVVHAQADPAGKAASHADELIAAAFRGI